MNDFIDKEGTGIELQGTEQPCVDRVHITVFAGDHGVAAEGVSAFPQAVTAEMVKNFAGGGAAISVAARALGASLEVINLGTAFDPGPLEGVKDYHLGPGTANFCCEAAMSEHQLAGALGAGRLAARSAQLNGAQLFIGGEMGIGNTTAAYHSRHHDIPLEALRRLGGFEIAALVGSYIACAHIGLPVLVDGFISTVAALAATRLCPGTEHWLLFSHTSAEPGHRLVLNALKAQPLLDLGMRLGEGSGAAVAVPLVRMACMLHNDMATFAEASVSEKRG
jgi:nicotinate-nucleotide--dimethylbenzimidazole phosphoribosyltransferase